MPKRRSDCEKVSQTEGDRFRRVVCAKAPGLEKAHSLGTVSRGWSLGTEDSRV